MKVAILAGGLGTRLGEETQIKGKMKPKPMVEIGGYPIIWHIMKIYSNYGFNDFVVLGGFEHKKFGEYFGNYNQYHSDVCINLTEVDIKKEKKEGEEKEVEIKDEEGNLIEITTIKKYSGDLSGKVVWNICVVDTGELTMTGGRIYRAKKYFENERFLLTYGDGVSDVNIPELIKFHEKSGKYATLTGVRPEERFGIVNTEEDGTVTSFQEKPKNEDKWINGGFFVCEPQIFDYIPEINRDNIMLEQEPLRNLVKDRRLGMYKHFGFWHPMDTLRDKKDLEKMWEQSKAPWKVWNDEQKVR